MRASAVRAAMAVLAAAAVSAVAWPVYGQAAFISCLEILGPLGAVTIVLADLTASERGRFHGLRPQLGAVAGLVAVQLGLAVALFASVMFVSRHYAFFMALAAGYAGLVGIGSARLV